MIRIQVKVHVASFILEFFIPLVYSLALGFSLAGDQ